MDRTLSGFFFEKMSTGGGKQGPQITPLYFIDELNWIFFATETIGETSQENSENRKWQWRFRWRHVEHRCVDSFLVLKKSCFKLILEMRVFFAMIFQIWHDPKNFSRPPILILSSFGKKLLFVCTYICKNLIIANWENYSNRSKKFQLYDGKFLEK